MPYLILAVVSMFPTQSDTPYYLLGSERVVSTSAANSRYFLLKEDAEVAGPLRTIARVATAPVRRLAAVQPIRRVGGWLAERKPLRGLVGVERRQNRRANGNGIFQGRTAQSRARR